MCPFVCHCERLWYNDVAMYIKPHHSFTAFQGEKLETDDIKMHCALKAKETQNESLWC